MHIKRALLICLMILPLSAFAHGEEVIVTFLIPVVLTMIFLPILYFVRLSANNKAILTITFSLSVIGAFFLIGKLPYTANEGRINLILGLFPIGVTISMYFIIKAVKANGK